MSKAQPVIDTWNIHTLNDMVLAQAENSGLMAYLRDIADRVKEDGSDLGIYIACEHLANILADDPFRRKIVERTRLCRGVVAPFLPFNNLPGVDDEAAE